MVCPKTKQRLALKSAQLADDGDIVAGVLESPAGTSYPIRNGVPRFVESHYASAFGLQWNKHASTQLDDRRHRHSAERFWGETGFVADEMRGRLTLDGGCGAGRFTDIAAAAGARVVAVDLSEAVDACYANNRRRDNVCVVQASLFELPFLPRSFDFAFTIGVIQHTPDPLRALQGVAEIVKNGGKLGVSWYKKYWYTYLHQKYWLRPLFRGWSDEKLYKFVSWYVPKLLPVSQLLSRVIPAAVLDRVLPVANRDFVEGLTAQERVEWAILDTYDWYSPKYDRPQTWHAVERVLAGLGYTCRRAPHGRRGLSCVRSSGG